MHNVIVSLLFVFCCLCPQRAGAGVYFSWQANSAQENIVGYRLYYGAQSRTVGGGYDQYIDFGSLQRCPAGGNGLHCSPLDEQAVTCENLYREEPKCMVNDLTGHLYFAMTAYNATAESDYSQEVEYGTTTGQLPPKVMVTLHQIYSLILEDF